MEPLDLDEVVAILRGIVARHEQEEGARADQLHVQGIYPDDLTDWADSIEDHLESEALRRKADQE